MRTLVNLVRSLLLLDLRGTGARGDEPKAQLSLVLPATLIRTTMGGTSLYFESTYTSITKIICLFNGKCIVIRVYLGHVYKNHNDRKEMNENIALYTSRKLFSKKL